MSVLAFLAHSVCPSTLSCHSISVSRIQYTHLPKEGWPKLKENPKNPKPLVAGGCSDGARSAAQGSVGRGWLLCPRSPGAWGVGPKAARCALMIVFSEESWTLCYTIFILFAKWMIIWVYLDGWFCIANMGGRRILPKFS